jgi:hypothetical protein
MDAEINHRLQELETDEEKYNFLLDSFEFIRESANESSNVSCETPGFSMLQKMEKSKKGDIYKKFIKRVYEKCEYIPYDETSKFSCHNCNSMNIIYIHNSSEQICGNCFVHEIVNTVDDIGFKEEQDIEKTIIYSYKRENHFNEWICQFQAKESTSVQPEIIDNIKNELKKQKIYQKNDITHTKIREILKKLGYNKYYEHTPYITTIVNGIKPPTMSQDLEDRLRLMFYQIQAPFDKFCPTDRINFLSYSYVLYKFCEIIGEDEYLPCFPILKSKEKLYKHDQIWKKITNELKWQFIPTI